MIIFNSENMDEKNLEPLIKRLDVLIHLQLKQQAQSGTSTREQIGILNSLGLNYNEIATIIGRSGSYVASELTLLKKKKR